MTVITLLNINLWILTIIGYIVYNLYVKNEKLERMVEERDARLQSVRAMVDESGKVLKELDTIGAFKSDDEIGFFFKTIQAIQETLSNQVKG